MVLHSHPKISVKETAEASSQERSPGWRGDKSVSIDYKQAGVDIEAGDALVDWLKKNAPSRWPHQERLVSGIGGFAALFRADFKDLKEPCLVSCTDGVGTKIKVAVHFESYKEVAQDLVAMCVNDLVCCGA